MMEVVVTAGVIGRAKLQSNHYHQQTNKPTPSLFYRPDALPVTQPTVLKHLREDCLINMQYTAALSSALCSDRDAHRQQEEQLPNFPGRSVGNAA